MTHQGSGVLVETPRLALAGCLFTSLIVAMPADESSQRQCVYRPGWAGASGRPRYVAAQAGIGRVVERTWVC